MEVVNLYGPTEATIDTTYWRSGPTGSTGEVRIGKPIVGVEVYVVEEGGGLVGEGVVGELCIGGAGLGRGYVKRGDLTGERFVPNPFSEGRGERMYRTGDLVRWSEGGELEYEGRVDEQVKVRGYRIEVGEVEEVMKREEGVGEAAVVVAGGEEEGGKGKRLVGYVVRRKEEGGSGEKWLKEMRERMREELPEYMVPWVVEELEEMPRLPNGKLDRKKLGRMAGGVVGKGGRGEYEGPGNAGEEILCGIWEEVLGQERVGVRDNFFEMGGHSLLAMQMISRVRGVFGVELALRRLFEKPTVRGLGEEIEGERRKGKRREVPELKRREGVGGRRKLSYAQQRLWFLDELEPGKARYNIPVGVRLEGELDKEALRKSLEEIVRRHEILRTRIVEEDGEVMQEVEEAGKWRMEEEEDLRGWGEGEREEELKRRVKEEGERAFDLRAGGLFRGKLLRMGEKDHVLMVVMHHIVSDGWSMGVMEGEFVELYRGYVEGREAGLGELEYQYGDYAEWQREWLQGEMLEEQVGYWREQLEGVEGLDLRMGKEQEEEEEEEEEEGKKKSGGVDGEGGEVVWELSAEVSRELVEMSRREGVTLFMLMLAGYQLMLSRYSGKRDVTVGVPIAGRRWSETEGMIGFFVNTLAMRSRWRGEESFVEMLRGVRERSLEAYEHQDVPFEKLVEELRPERDLRRAPLFQVMFVMEKAEGKRREMELPGIRVGGVEMGGGMEKFEMTMTVVEGGRGGRIGGGLSYRKELFSKRSMERMMRQWERLMGEIAKDPQRRVEEYSLLEESERERVLEEWNATGVEIPDGCVHRLFEEQAELRPDAIAVVSGEKSLTYGELNARANQLAHYLRSCGVTAETGVALCCERSLELIVGMLGIVKAGGAYVPLDASYPRERLRWMLEDANVAVLLTAQGKDKELPEGAYLRLRLDEDWERIAEKSRENPVAVSGAGNLAYIIYTSGSTGEPKGVAVEHRGIVRLVRGANFFEVSADDVFLQFGSVTFDVSTFEVWGALGNGARLVMAPPHMPTMEELGEVIEGSGVTVLWLTSGLFQQMVETQLERMRGVKQFLAGGDVVSVAHMRKVGEAMPECALINGYGPTENTTFTACYRRKGDGGELSSFPIGKAISNTSVYVLDEGLEAVPVGVAGELYTGGKGLARGYVGKGDLTGERFVPNPFSEVGGERMYGTGDLVRWGEDGNLEFLGRKDQQVKVRGYRIELGEIEEALLGCEGVRQAVVVAAGGGGGGGEGGGREKRLVGYVVEGEEGQVRESELRERLREGLPEYMVPAAIEKMKEIPLNASGKVDRKKLTGMASEAKILNDGMAPRDFVELELTRLCQELLGRDGIGIRDNFFDLGGHSLLAIRLISMIHRKFNVRIPLAAIFQHPSIEALAPLLRTEGPAVPLTCAIELKRGSKRPLFFVHGAGGSAFSFVELARSMNADRSFIAFQDAGIEHGSGSTSIEGMAAQYVEAIGDFQPEGPYLLGGWSMGGMIAFEMARLLRSQGRVVDFLALVDSHPPALTGRRKAEGVEITLQNFLLMMGIKEEIAPVTDITTPIEKRLEIAHRQAMEAELVPSGLDLAVFQRLFEVYCRHNRAVESYRPRHCDLTPHLWQATGVSLVKGKEDGGTARAHKLVESHQAAAERRWQKLTAEVHINRIAGDHFSILREPHVRALANALDLALDRVDFEFDRDKSLTG
jgi:amino acid adenylation domain-containing protein